MPSTLSAADHGCAIDQFCAQMREYGLDTNDTIIGDGKLHRFTVSGDRDKTGWYVLHLDDQPAGMFGCNRRYGEEKFSWADKSRRKTLSPEEKREYARRMREQEEQRVADQNRRQADAQKRAQAIWDAATPETADSDHPYLVDKQVQALGLRRGRWEYVNEETGEVSLVSDKALLVPFRDRTGQIHSLQGIFPNIQNFLKRNKDYLKNGAKQGFFHALGKPRAHEGQPVFIICEGYATGASIHMATGHCVLVTFDSGNLRPVAESVRAGKADAHIIIAADNDQWTLQPVPNPGLAKGTAAARAVGGMLVFPPFADTLGIESIEGGKVKVKGPTDFNDWHQAYGLQDVADLVLGALQSAPLIEDAFDDAFGDPEPVTPPQALAVTDQTPPDLPPVPPSFPMGADDDDGGVYDDETLLKNKHFTVLGYDQGDYYLFNHAKGQVCSLRKGDCNVLGLVEHAPLNWWEEHFPAAGSAKFDHVMAAEWLFHQAHARGIYDPTRIRGRGAWQDNGRAIYHHGPFLTVDGERCELTKLESGYVYTRARSLPMPHEYMLTKEEGAHLVEIASLPRWTMPGSAALMAGWVMLASICGSLGWRSHIWLTGGAGSGKTTLQKLYCGGLTRGTMVYALGNSTEAGIRQALKGDALPVMIDEFESNNERERQRVENIMSLIRQTSSETQAKTLKGTVSGDGMHFDIRSMFCLASINTNLPTKADVDRLTILRLRSGPNSTAVDHWDQLEAELNKIDQDPVIAQRLLARALTLMPVILESVKVFRRVAARFFDRQRDGDQFGTLLAGCWCLQKDHVPTDAEAMVLIKGYDWSEHREDHDEDEAEKALAALLNAKVRMGGGLSDQTVYELIRESSTLHRKNTVDPVLAEDQLRKHGIIADHKQKRLTFGTSVPNLKALAEGMTAITDIRGQLMRIPGAMKGDKAVSFNGSKSKVVSVPLAPILGDDPEEPQF